MVILLFASIGLRPIPEKETNGKALLDMVVRDPSENAAFMPHSFTIIGSNTVPYFKSNEDCFANAVRQLLGIQHNREC